MAAVFNPFTMEHHQRQGTGKAIPIIAQTRPAMLQKLGKASLPIAELLADLTKKSKPIF